MSCQFCQAVAVTRCNSCGTLVCEEHGKNDICPGCSTGIVAGGPQALAVSKKPLPPGANAGWWRPQQAEEYTPPACYECQGLARGKCRNCLSSYCSEHAGSNGLCQACGRSANLGLYIIAGTFAAIVLLLLINWLLY